MNILTWAAQRGTERLGWIWATKLWGTTNPSSVLGLVPQAQRNEASLEPQPQGQSCFFTWQALNSKGCLCFFQSPKSKTYQLPNTGLPQPHSSHAGNTVTNVNGVWLISQVQPSRCWSHTSFACVKVLTLEKTDLTGLERQVLLPLRSSPHTHHFYILIQYFQPRCQPAKMPSIPVVFKNC